MEDQGNTGNQQVRRISAIVLLVLFAIVLYAGNQAAWLARTVTDTDRFVETLAPLPEDEAVAEALSVAVAAKLVEGQDIQGRIADLLPDGLSFLALPVTDAVEGVAADFANRIISSDAFASLWQTTLRITHATVIALVDGGDEGAIVADDGVVYLDLTALAERIDEGLTERGLDVIEMDDVDARIVLLEGDQLGFAQTIADVIYSVRWGAIIGTFLLLVATIIVAPDRRFAVTWLGIASAFVMLLTIVELRWLHTAIVGGIADPVNQAAASSTWRLVWDGLVVQTVIVLVASILVALTAWAFGPSPRAHALRDAVQGSPATTEPGFVSRNLRALQWAAIGLGLLILLIVPTLSGMIFISVGIAVVAIVASLSLIASRRSGTESA